MVSFPAQTEVRSRLEREAKSAFSDFPAEGNDDLGTQLLEVKKKVETALTDAMAEQSRTGAEMIAKTEEAKLSLIT